MDMQATLDEIAEAVGPQIGSGVVAEYIPRLAAVNPDQFGMSVVMNDGSSYGVGDFEVPFSIQSISKVFTLVLALQASGDAIWDRVGREPSGAAFNSLAQLEFKRGIPRNPFMNAGALVVTDHLLGVSGTDANPLLDLLRTESGNPEIRPDALVSTSEAGHSDRNRSIAYLLSSFGNLRNEVGAVLDRYFDQCAISMSCAELAAAGAFLSRGGVRADGTELISPLQAKRVNAVMLTAGFYDAAAEFAYRVGLPGKSGVGGGILAIVPGKCSICVWAPGLDSAGNSLVGMAALDEFTSRTGWSVF